ncbi:TIGR04149 family rSAM-modified RiPP [uncultured Parabacteroides sp.]|uniref:TIGR04149 family rSAM-modified RiPP n=1 Tax=uncultured Parabacteroides sp. TaxID=512312 RepID=UPI0034344D61
MKTLGKIKLNEFRKVELEKRKMNSLKGGCVCKCGCTTLMGVPMDSAGTSNTGHMY